MSHLPTWRSMTYTAASHQGAIHIIWLLVREVVVHLYLQKMWQTLRILKTLTFDQSLCFPRPVSSSCFLVLFPRPVSSSCFLVLRHLKSFRSDVKCWTFFTGSVWFCRLSSFLFSPFRPMRDWRASDADPPPPPPHVGTIWLVHSEASVKPQLLILLDHKSMLFLFSCMCLYVSDVVSYANDVSLMLRRCVFILTMCLNDVVSLSGGSAAASFNGAGG